MQILAAIDPVTRIEGHMKVNIKVDTINGVQQVVDAWSVGTLFRGFENLLIDRDPRDAQHITERICGVCPVSHGMAAVLALDAAAKLTAPSNARIMRNLVMGANFIDSHILHFYLLAALDYIDGPAMPPWQPSWNVDKRFDAATTQTLVSHYVTAIDMRRKAHEMGAIFGGRMPHPPAFIPGGFTTVPHIGDIIKFKAYLNTLIPFIRDVYIPDVEALAKTYADYYAIGKGPGNLMSFGCFEQDDAGKSKLFQRGVLPSGSAATKPVNLNAITEQVKYSWYADGSNNLAPDHGKTVPQYPKKDAYSWLKAPRLGGVAYEVGALARMAINGDYRKGTVSVMDRHAAKAYEALKIAKAMLTWLDQIQVSQPSCTAYTTPKTATAMGLTEAPRGALGHWVSIDNGKIARYQVITPTCWNASPRDSQGRRGPLEQALHGTPVKNINQPIEVLRVIHSFDPCLDCAVHVIKPSSKAKVFALPHYHGGEEVHTHTHDHGDGQVHSHGADHGDHTHEEGH